MVHLTLVVLLPDDEERLERERCATAVDLFPLVTCHSCHHEMGYDWSYCWNRSCPASPAFVGTNVSLSTSTVSLVSHNKPLAAKSSQLVAFDLEAKVQWLGTKWVEHCRGMFE
jgi:hypothetical protein